MKVVISGYGRMGKMVKQVLLQRGVECAGASEDITDFDPSIAVDCVCVDFTTPDAFRKNYKSLADNFKAVVVGTTGWYDILPEVRDYFAKRGKTLIYSSNFSVGVNILFKMTEIMSRLTSAFGGYACDIKEIHHIHKLDKPSGTAKTLADIVEGACGVRPEIESVREGEVPGIHSVDFHCDVDRINLTHEAFSREGFAQGAVQAALMTEGVSGVHEFRDLINDKFNSIISSK
ncbi:MAG: dihydrodipicolinate reductase C-terminal domain-containing protein [Bacteroidales bacterium]